MRIASLLLLVSLLPACAGLGGPRRPMPPERSSARAEALNRYLAGVIHQRNGRFEDAVAEFRRAAETAPDAMPLFIQLLQSYLRMQDFDNAYTMCKQATELSPEDASLWIVLGGICRRLERDEEAAEAFRKAVELNPSGRLGYEELIRAEEKTNDLIAVIDMSAKLIELTPKVPELHFRHGLSLMRTNNPEAAKASLLRALELNPKLSRARYFLGLIYLQLHENKQAAGELERYVAESPKDAGGHENLAVAYAREYRYPEAIQQLAFITSGEEAGTEHHLATTALLLRAGDFDRAAAMAPPTEALIQGTFLRAYARKGQGQPYRFLLDSLDQVDGDFDAECGAFLNGLLYYFEPDDALAFFVDAIQGFREEGVRSRRLDLLLARVLMSLEHFEDAEKVLLEVLERFEADKWVHYYLAMVYEGLDRAEDSALHLRATLEFDPADPEVMNFLGYLYAEENTRLDEAEELLNRALKMEPESGFYLDSLGWVYYRQGKAELAVEYIRRAILKMDRDDAILRDHLGDAYLLLGETKKAVAEWERARRLDPELEGVAEKIEKHRKETPKR